MKDARKVNQAELERVFNAYLYSTKAELKAAKKSVVTPMIDKLVITIMLKGEQFGNPHHFEFILSRLIPKLKESEPDPSRPALRLAYRLDELPQVEEAK